MSSTFDSLDLYATLSLTKSATPLEIKQSYRRLALIHHPDKVPNDSPADVIQAANDTFQQVGFAYAVLKDVNRRAVYDKSGRTDGQEGAEARTEDEWRAYFKELWSGEVNANTIEEFTKAYQGSPEEETDILAAYTTSSGSLDVILSSIMCSTVDDEDRFITLIDSAIRSGSITSFPAWTKQSKDSKAKEKRRAKANKEALEAEAYAKELGVHDQLFGGAKGGKGKGNRKGKGKAGSNDDEDALKALIQGKRASALESMIEGIEAKYAPKGKTAAPKKRKSAGKGKSGESDQEDAEEEDERPKKGKRSKKEVEPTDEEFEKIQREMEARRAATKSKSSASGTTKKGRK
ncbi:hypothetical protein P7C70_g485, partial [Phenoliferia sp. Uapishka_3]